VNLGVRQCVQLLTQDKVNFLLGPFSSNDALDQSSVAEKYQVPMVQGGGASSQIFARNYKFIFGTLPPADDYYASTIKMLMKMNPKPKTVALVAADDSFDVSVAKGTRKLLKEAGLELWWTRSTGRTTPTSPPSSRSPSRRTLTSCSGAGTRPRRSTSSARRRASG